MRIYVLTKTKLSIRQLIYLNKSDTRDGGLSMVRRLSIIDGPNFVTDTTFINIEYKVIFIFY